LIGKIVISIIPYYDMQSRKKSFKRRPVLVIGGPRNNDYTVLPVSTISKKQFLDTEYDIEIDPAIYPLTYLTKVSYVRTHKQTVVNCLDLRTVLADLKSDYPDLYESILMKLQSFNEMTMTNAL